MEVIMSRVQLALNVDDLDAAVTFYSKLFGVAPAKRKPGYANFAVAEPPLKLVLIEGEAGGTLNHLGVEVETSEAVTAAESRLATAGLATTGVDDTTCCYAQKTETWVSDPDGAPWELYVKTGDAEQMASATRPGDGAAAAAACCAPAAMSEAVARGDSPASSCC
jgi:catechol 2,3-dioxygenase-like lactoylglutathione lyase family enzyme